MFIIDLFHPRYAFAVQPFSYGKMRHGVIGGSSVPVFDIGRAQHYVSLPDDLDRAAPFLGQPGAERNNQCLAQRMGMPAGTRARLKGDIGAIDTLRGLGIKSRINADIACKILFVCRGRRAGTCRNHELSLGLGMSRGDGYAPGKKQTKNEK